MLNELRRFNNLGTPNYFYELLKTLDDNKTVQWKLPNLKDLFYNRIVDGRNIYDGCIDLALNINILCLNEEFIIVNKDFSKFLNSIGQMSDKFNECLFIALKNDESFHKIFCSEFLSYDIVYKSIQISNSAFGFKFSNFKQLLIDFDVIETHPTPEINSFILNPRYKRLFDKTVLPEIRKRKIGVDELRQSLEQQQIDGEEAERFVLKFEHNRLSQFKKIDWVAEYIANEGYDIASYDNEFDDEYNRFIEVKSYEGNSPYFFWSRNEYTVAERRQEKYWLYLVNRKEMNDEDYIPKMIQNPFIAILKNPNSNIIIEKYKITL